MDEHPGSVRTDNGVDGAETDGAWAAFEAALDAAAPPAAARDWLALLGTGHIPEQGLVRREERSGQGQPSQCGALSVHG